MTDPGTNDGTTRTEGQTARDIFPEVDGIPETAQDDSPTMQRAEDPQFEALPGEHPTASVDFGTTAFEQSQGESLAGRLDRELPDDAPDVRPAADQEATGGAPIAGEGPEESAVHIIEG